MKELSLNILDIAQNSVSAEATCIEILLDETETHLTLTIRDNGKGMSPEFAATVTDPFSTTRTTRKVGMGLPLLKLAAEQTGGRLTLTSVPRSTDPTHCGTCVTADFDKTHLDFTPLGDVISSLTTLIQGSPDVDFVFRHMRPEGTVELDTREVREVLGGTAPLNDPEILLWMRESLSQQYAGDTQGS